MHFIQMQRSAVSQVNTNKSKSCKDLSISTGHYHHMETMLCNLLTKECVLWQLTGFIVHVNMMICNVER